MTSLHMGCPRCKAGECPWYVEVAKQATNSPFVDCTLMIGFQSIIQVLTCTSPFPPPFLNNRKMHTSQNLISTANKQLYSQFSTDMAAKQLPSTLQKTCLHCS